MPNPETRLDPEGYEAMLKFLEYGIRESQEADKIEMVSAIKKEVISDETLILECLLNTLRCEEWEENVPRIVRGEFEFADWWELRHNLKLYQLSSVEEGTRKPPKLTDETRQIILDWMNEK